MISDATNANPLCRVELFGKLRALRGDVVISRFESRKAALLLALLALPPGRTRSREELIERLWPDVRPEIGRNRLKQALASLRRQLEPPGTPSGSVLLADRFTLEGNAQALTTDVGEFETLLRATPSLSAQDEIERLTRAIALYQDELLPGFYEEWVLAERERLSLAYQNALVTLAERLQQNGQKQEAISWLHRLVATDPYREQARLNLMRLYVEAGQLSEARHQYREMERFLREELGAAPSPEAQALAASLENCPAVLASMLPSLPAVAHPPVANGSASVSAAETRLPPISLPLTLSRFFGRETEITHVREAFGYSGKMDFACRLVTLTGTGGIGKTRLAIESARQIVGHFAGGICFVPLAEATEAPHVFEAIIAALRLPREGHGEPMARLLTYFQQSSGETLLILDNFEQVVEAGAPIVHTLLEQIASLRCLVTSRFRLNLEGEVEIPINPLPVPETTDSEPGAVIGFASVQTFVDRAQKARPDFQVTPRNAQTIAAICRALEGLPLALELAASWARALTPGQMLEKLNARFELLVSRRRDIAPRHRSMHNAIAWSYRLLTPLQQTFFRRLSVFRGDWTLEATEAILTSHQAASLPETEPDFEGLSCLELTIQLQDRSLIVAHEAGTIMRYRLLETLREYASEQLEPAERDAVRHRHALFYTVLAERASGQLGLAESKTALEEIEAEIDNLRVALAWAEETQAWETGLRLAVALAPFWRFAGLHVEGQSWLERFLNGSERGSSPLHGQGLLWAGVLACLQQKLTLAQQRLDESLTLYRAIEDTEGIACSLKALGILEFYRKDLAAAVGYWEESLRLFQEIDNRQEVALARFNLAVGWATLNAHETALQFYEQSLALYREIGLCAGLYYCLESFGGFHLDQGDVVMALSLIAEALTVVWSLGLRRSVHPLLYRFAEGLLLAGDADTAVTLFSAGSALHHHMAPPPLVPDAAHLEQVLARLHAALDENAFTTAWERGAQLDAQTAIHLCQRLASGRLFDKNR